MWRVVYIGYLVLVSLVMLITLAAVIVYNAVAEVFFWMKGGRV